MNLMDTSFLKFGGLGKYPAVIVLVLLALR
jgi:hypothetical protein